MVMDSYFRCETYADCYYPHCFEQMMSKGRAWDAHYFVEDHAHDGLISAEDYQQIEQLVLDKGDDYDLMKLQNAAAYYGLIEAPAGMPTHASTTHES